MDLEFEQKSILIKSVLVVLNTYIHIRDTCLVNKPIIEILSKQKKQDDAYYQSIKSIDQMLSLDDVTFSVIQDAIANIASYMSNRPDVYQNISNENLENLNSLKDKIEKINTIDMLIIEIIGYLIMINLDNGDVIESVLSNLKQEKAITVMFEINNKIIQPFVEAHQDNLISASKATLH